MVERPLIGRGLFLTNGRVANYQRVHTNQAMNTLTEYTCLSILPAFPRVGGKPDHVSLQGKEAVLATHDIYSISGGLMVLAAYILKSGCFSDILCKAVCAGVNCCGFISKSEYFSVISWIYIPVCMVYL